MKQPVPHGGTTVIHPKREQYLQVSGFFRKLEKSEAVQLTKRRRKTESLDVGLISSTSLKPENLKRGGRPDRRSTPEENKKKNDFVSKKRKTKPF